MTNALPEDETIITCKLSNQAGEVSKNFKLKVLSKVLSPLNIARLVPPKLEGSIVEDISVIESTELDLQCLFFGEPNPTVTWTKDGLPLSSKANVICSFSKFSTY